MAQQSRHLPDAESPRVRIHHVLEHRGALAEIESAIPKGQRLARCDMVELATIGNAVELRPLPRNLHLGEVDIRADASEIGVDERERDCGASGAAPEIEHATNVGSKVTPDPRQQVLEMMIDDAEAVAIEDGRRQLFEAPRGSRANGLDELSVA